MTGVLGRPYNFCLCVQKCTSHYSMPRLLTEIFQYTTERGFTQIPIDVQQGQGWCLDYVNYFDINSCYLGQLFYKIKLHVL